MLKEINKKHYKNSETIVCQFEIDEESGITLTTAASSLPKGGWSYQLQCNLYLGSVCHNSESTSVDTNIYSAPCQQYCSLVMVHLFIRPGHLEVVPLMTPQKPRPSVTAVLAR